MTETRITNETTGGEKGQKPARMSYLPTGPLLAVAEHYAKGAEKYEDHNWRKGYDWSLSYDALQRHAMAFWSGEDIDEETGSPHMAAVVFHALALLEFAETHRELDNRYRAAEPEPDFYDGKQADDLLKRLTESTLTQTFTIDGANLKGFADVFFGSSDLFKVDREEPLIVDTNEIAPEVDEIIENTPKAAPTRRWGFQLGDRVSHARLIGDNTCGTIVSLAGDMPVVLWDDDVLGLEGQRAGAFPQNLTVIELKPVKVGRASVREILRAVDGQGIDTTYTRLSGTVTRSRFEFDHSDLVQFLDIIEDAGLEITHMPTSPLAD